jgi:glyoxylase-like metal-dependent hydrolase (beta-lactamase superfamily II)
MRLHELNTGYFKLDGGAMFGVVPKGIWNKLNPADEKNLCTWAMRCMLIEDGDRLILIDTGIGNKQSEKFFGYYYLHDMLTLESALKLKGFGVDDVTDVFLTHLHFDHVGGAVQYNASKDRLEPVFKNAKYWSNKQHWDWATVDPNPREKASFLKENILPIQESGQLHFIEQNSSEILTQSPLPGIEVFFANGHTEAQMIPVIQNGNTKVVFGADLIPSAYHIPQAYVMGYDMRPLQTIADKNSLFPLIHQNNWQIFLEHDPVNEFITLNKGEKGYSVKEKGLFNS